MDGTAGRRACLSGGPDVWQVIRALREIPTDQYDPVETVCIEADLHERQVNLAIQYCEAYPDEVEAMIAKDAAAIHLIDTMIAERDAALAQADQSDISEKHDLDSGLSL